MRPNTIRDMWQRDETVVNGWLQIAHPFAAEVMAHQGFDSLTVDMQHGPIFYENALLSLQAVSTTEVIPMARVPWNEPGIIMKMLDAGCYGIICPMVNNREQAEAFVGACRYAPRGYRSYGPTRASLYAGRDYAAHADETIITMAMIETAEAMQNLDDILSTPGLDAIYVGPADLSISLRGNPVPDMDGPEVNEALDTIIEAVHRHQLFAGIHTGSAASARQMRDRGFRFVTISSDAGMLATQAASAVNEVKSGKVQVEKPSKGPY